MARQTDDEPQKRSKGKQRATREETIPAVQNPAHTYRSGERMRNLLYPDLRSSTDIPDTSGSEPEPKTVTRWVQDTENAIVPRYRSLSPPRGRSRTPRRVVEASVRGLAGGSQQSRGRYRTGIPRPPGADHASGSRVGPSVHTVDTASKQTQHLSVDHSNYLQQLPFKTGSNPTLLPSKEVFVASGRALEAKAKKQPAQKEDHTEQTRKQTEQSEKAISSGFSEKHDALAAPELSEPNAERRRDSPLSDHLEKHSLAPSGRFTNTQIGTHKSLKGYQEWASTRKRPEDPQRQVDDDSRPPASEPQLLSLPEHHISKVPDERYAWSRRGYKLIRFAPLNPIRGSHPRTNTSATTSGNSSYLDNFSELSNLYPPAEVPQPADPRRTNNSTVRTSDRAKAQDSVEPSHSSPGPIQRQKQTQGLYDAESYKILPATLPELNRTVVSTLNHVKNCGSDESTKPTLLQQQSLTSAKTVPSSITASDGTDSLYSPLPHAKFYNLPNIERSLPSVRGNYKTTSRVTSSQYSEDGNETSPQANTDVESTQFETQGESSGEPRSRSVTPPSTETAIAEDGWKRIRKQTERFRGVEKMRLWYAWYLTADCDMRNSFKEHFLEVAEEAKRDVLNEAPQPSITVHTTYEHSPRRHHGTTTLLPGTYSAQRGAVDEQHPNLLLSGSFIEGSRQRSDACPSGVQQVAETSEPNNTTDGGSVSTFQAAIAGGNHTAYGTMETLPTRFKTV